MIQLILGFLISLFSALVAIYEKWKNRNEPDFLKNNRIAVILLLIALSGGALSFFAGICAISEKKISDDESKKRQEKINSQSKMIYDFEILNYDLINKNIEYSRRLDSSSKLNYLMSKEIRNQTKALGDYSTGKGSYCYFDLGDREPNTNSYHLCLYSAGVNPMDNVVARIVDILDMKNNPGGTILHIGKVYPKIHTVHLFETTYTLVDPDRIWLNIFFQSGDREIVEGLKKVRINGKFVNSLEISENRKTLFKRIDPNFPKDFLARP